MSVLLSFFKIYWRKFSVSTINTNLMGGVPGSKWRKTDDVGVQIFFSTGYCQFFPGLQYSFYPKNSMLHYLREYLSIYLISKRVKYSPQLHAQQELLNSSPWVDQVPNFRQEIRQSNYRSDGLTYDFDIEGNIT